MGKKIKGGHLFETNIKYFDPKNSEVFIIKDNFTTGKFEVHYRGIGQGNRGIGILAFFKTKKEAEAFKVTLTNKNTTP